MTIYNICTNLYLIYLITTYQDSPQLYEKSIHNLSTRNVILLFFPFYLFASYLPLVVTIQHLFLSIYSASIPLVPISTCNFQHPSIPFGTIRTFICKFIIFLAIVAIQLLQSILVCHCSHYYLFLCYQY